jgi:hypothetical protein
MLTGLRGRVHARCSIGFCPRWTSCPCPCPASGVAPCPSRSTRGPSGLVESQVVVQRIACGRSHARTVLAGRIWGSVKSAGHHDHGHGSRRSTGPVLHRCSNPRPTTATDPPTSRDLFEPLPGEGRWHQVLHADRNVGIGGLPPQLLRRCDQLLRPGGSLLCETDPPGTGLRLIRTRREPQAGLASDWFPCARAGPEGGCGDGRRRRADLGQRVDRPRPLVRRAAPTLTLWISPPRALSPRSPRSTLAPSPRRSRRLTGPACAR